MRSIQRSQRLNRHGFTLIELIITIVVAGIVAVPLCLMLGAHVDSVFHAQDMVMANQLGRYEMEVVNNLAYANINNATFLNYQGYPFDMHRSVSYVNGNAISAESTKRVDVWVARFNQSRVLANFTSFVTKNVIYPF